MFMYVRGGEGGGGGERLLSLNNMYSNCLDQGWCACILNPEP
jgi:hypothetical protein